MTSRSSWSPSVALASGAWVAWAVPCSFAFAFIGFSVGFVGPLLLRPDANQGPLLGIFFTGPLGFVVGFVAGSVIPLLCRNSRRIAAAIAAVALLYAGSILLILFLTGGTHVPSANPKDAEAVKGLPADIVAMYARDLSDDAIPELARFAELTTLNFGSGWKARDAQITDVGLSRLAHLELPRLRWLSLSHCQHVGDAGVEHVAEMKTLVMLRLSECDGVTDQALRHIAKMDHLETLDLRGCDGISDAGLEHLAEMSNLKWLSLGGCKNLSNAAVLKLQRELPNCTVSQR